uniref:SH2 domain-containing protein n=1 Tax=Rhabditophanes sp. KR3021 TaxID=114890 RepID=A0AC35UAF4_9BILA
MTTNEDQSILQQPWYHGFLTREDQPSMLKKCGDLLVRTSEPAAGKQRCYILSILINQNTHEIKHYVVRKTSNNKLTIGDTIISSEQIQSTFFE